MRLPRRSVALALATVPPLGAAAAQPGAAPPRATGADAASAAPVVRTRSGLVAGVVLSEGVRVFRGIPYAAPPVRDLRWRPPQPAAPWTGVRQADRFGPQCMQARVFDDMVFRSAGTGEDCLYLNVWAPPAAGGGAPNAAAGRPVLVYFYGGGFIAGDGSEPRYDGEAMARRGIVAVTLNYRLGVFGFFSHPALSAEAAGAGVRGGASGNYGLMDQAAALRWVRENVAAFGGDPARVTIAGESAGSFSVSAQMAAPRSRGLFAGAIGESGAFFGSTLAARERAATERDGARFAEAVGAGAGDGAGSAAALAALRALSAAELLDAAARPGMPRFGPNVDGAFLPRAPAEVFAAGAQAPVPLLAGWNSEEASAEALVRGPVTPDSARALYARLFGDSLAAAAAQVFPAATADEARQSVTDLAGDRFIGYSTWKWLDEHGRTGGRPVYRYLFARPRPPAATDAAAAPAAQAGPAARGAVHSAEIEYALGNLGRNRVFAWTPDDHRVSELMQRYFANFIAAGDPNGPGLPRWPAGNARAEGAPVMRMRIDVAPRAEPEPRARYLFLDRAAGAGAGR